jgi:hypothetical protein
VVKMGKKIAQIFDIVATKKGFDGRMKLAEQCGISKSKALEVEDSPELMKTFRKEASTIIGEDISKYI